MKIAFLQFNPIFGDVEGNVDKALSLISNVDFDLIVFPELFNTGYLFLDRSEVETFAEDIPNGYTCKRLMKYASERGVFIVAGLAERFMGKLYNSVVIVGSKGIVGVYRKAHLFNREKLLFDAGNSDFNVYDLGFVKVGVMICFDWCFPEVARILAIKGADIICHPSNLVLPYATMVMRARAIENRVYVITANRIGFEERNGLKLRYIGLSQIVSPDMNVLCSAGENEEVVGVIDVDVSLARNKWITPLNHVFNDRRIDLYKHLTSNV